MGGLGQAQYDLLVPFGSLAQSAFLESPRTPPKPQSEHGASTEQASRTDVSGQCEVVAKCEWTTELPQNAERKRLAPTQTTEERADRISPLCYTQITSPFWRSEAAETKP